MPFYQSNMTEHEGYDVVVAGGGVAGVAAALAARRQGCSVLLLEKNCTLGGLATSGLVNLFVPLCNGRGIQIVKGMAEEFLRESIRYGYNTLNDTWRDGEPGQPVNLRYATFFSSGIFALQMTEMLRKEGVDLLLDAAVEDTVMEGARCKGVVVLGEEGHIFFPARVVVDATGSSLIFRRAGAETVSGKNYFSYFGYGLSLSGCEAAVAGKNIRYAYRWYFGGDASLYGRRHPEGMEYFYGDTSRHVTDYLIANQLCLLDKLKTEEPSSRDLVTLPSMPQLRTVRRIRGGYTLNEGDLFRHFDDSVTALCDSERRDSLYEIPYRCMYDGSFDNLIAAGRNIAADGYLWNVVRVIPPAIVTGQAAGIAAALAVKSNGTIPGLPPGMLQEQLTKSGVMVHFQDGWIPAGRTAGEYSPASHSHPDRS